MSPFTCASVTGVFNVRDYGAIGDGVADDGPAIRQAIAAAANGAGTNTGGMVYLPPGKYQITSTETTADGLQVGLNCDRLVNLQLTGSGALSGGRRSASRIIFNTPSSTHSQISARVPEKVSRGVFSTGAMVFQGPHEFVIDFVLSMAAPHQIAARVVLPLSIMPSVIGALRENLANYQAKFGPPPALPVPTPPPTPVWPRRPRSPPIA